MGWCKGRVEELQPQRGHSGRSAGLPYACGIQVAPKSTQSLQQPPQKLHPRALGSQVLRKRRTCPARADLLYSPAVIFCFSSSLEAMHQIETKLTFICLACLVGGTTILEAGRLSNLQSSFDVVAIVAADRPR